MNIFFSYPRDANVPLVERVKADLELRGHAVWFDSDQIRYGTVWRDKITRGILGSDRVVAFLSKHAVRDPGVCLNEIAIALAEKGDEAVVTVLVEPEGDVSAPVSITHIQWIRMDGHHISAADAGWYRTRFDQLVEVIERPGGVARNAELEQLKLVLNPLSFNADIAYHLPRFTGREWLLKRYESWLSDHPRSKVFRIEGGPGMGKTAVASQLAHATKSSVLGVHLCKAGSAATRNPGRLVLSLAYQMATRLPDYRARLLRVSCIKDPTLMQGEDAGSLWDMLISEPLAGAGKAGLIDRQRLSIVIDGLDEATKDGRNVIVELLVKSIETLPAWVGVVLTGRADPELTARLKHYQPEVISGDTPENRQDLRQYIDEWLKEEMGAGRLQERRVSLVAETLLQKSEGAFLYLVQVREQAQQGSEDGSRRFDLDNPASLPQGLYRLYLEFFERRFPEALDGADNPLTRWNALVKPLLGYILASPEPLPLDLARALIGWNADSAGNEKQHKALQALGSLIKRTGNADQPETCTLAPFHNSAREWIGSEAAGVFRIFAKQSIYSLAEALWHRYLEREEQDAYVWRVLPELLPSLSGEIQDALLGEPDWEGCQVLYRLADGMAPELRFTESLGMWLTQVRYSQRLCEATPEKAQFARDLQFSFCHLGDTLSSLGRTGEALDYYERGLKIAEDLAARAPENAEFARDLSVIFERLGDTLSSLGRTGEVPDYYERGLKIAEDLAARAPENAEFARCLSDSFSGLGKTLSSLGRTGEALDYNERGLKIAEDLAARAPENAVFARDLSVSFERLGETLSSLGRTGEALDYYERGLKIAEDLAARAPENAVFERGLWVSYWNLSIFTRDDLQLRWRNKAYSALASMKARGILAVDDERYLAEIRSQLGLD